MIEGHGDDAYRYGCEIKHNFSTNVYCGFDHSALVSHLASVAGSIKRYPEPSPSSVEKVLADQKGVTSRSVMVTNGATEAIYLIAQMMRGSKSCIVEPTFSEYRDACAVHGHTVCGITDMTAIPEDADAVWLCNPNNPTGQVTDSDMLRRCIECNPSVLFIIDGAYADYSMVRTMDEKEVCGYGNVILLGSLTKRFAIPGLRIGYAVANHKILDRLRAMRMPWSVNQLAIEGAKYMLAHASEYPIDATTLHSEAVRIGESLSKLGIEITPTDCNILLGRLPHGKARDLKDYLAERHGILIRDAGNFHGLSPAHFRIAPLSSPENDTLIGAIAEWLSEQ
ncbi:MAG: aminotransferase class I/II-fold pyridoxal phosphate-dependent enzyme [Duncaniella sp.]|nr:aminotransferase class I/II-fold pyridoxal phosphate-dependent enzyme [Duncaniella sp.]